MILPTPPLPTLPQGSCLRDSRELPPLSLPLPLTTVFTYHRGYHFQNTARLKNKYFIFTLSVACLSSSFFHSVLRTAIFSVNKIFNDYSLQYKLITTKLKKNRKKNNKKETEDSLIFRNNIHELVLISEPWHNECN